MKNSILASIAVLACACVKAPPRTPDRIAQDVAYITVKVQHRADASAIACHRATTAAAIAVANVTAPLSRREAVASERYEAMAVADKAMLSVCAKFR